MDDLTQKIQTILSDEESMKQLSELAAMLGLAGDGSGGAPAQATGGGGFPNQGSGGVGFTNQGSGGSSFPSQSLGGSSPGQGGGLAGSASALSQLLGGGQAGSGIGGQPGTGLGGQPGSGLGTQSAAGDGLGGLDFAALANLASSLKGFTAEDENIRFILALKPLLSPKKQARADGAVKILRLLNMLPLIKQSGLLGELLG